eukprot:TRINITY_DN32824_c0_g1_i1.p1 TRINITY_DN32824_c0_g1~~TRINITY_DN32824_c0_g1_i1.p1  ORF type:complete len:237 (-),score=2.97 TRINITY_DN32824_c0_g1_i1:110-820(-)
MTKQQQPKSEMKWGKYIFQLLGKGLFVLFLRYLYMMSQNTAPPVAPWEYSNWVLYPSLLVGAYPVTKSTTDGTQNTVLLAENVLEDVTLFIDLVNHTEKAGTPYSSALRAHQQYLNVPINDHSIPTTQLDTFCSALEAAYTEITTKQTKRGESGALVYVHCWGGHGRTGVFASILLAKVKGMSAEVALGAVSRLHKEGRKKHGRMGVPGNSPQTEEQRQFVRDFLENEQTYCPPPK